jgi:hypothetical protein
MKRIIAGTAFCISLAIAVTLSSKDAGRREARPDQPYSRMDIEGYGHIIPDFMQPRAEVDTFHIVHYDFESMDWQGWTRFDNTAQRDSFWHVEDYLESELSEFPCPLEGTKSAWCGALSGDDEYMCSWSAAPGYGNDWDQSLISDPIYFTGALTVSFKGYFESEPGFDRTYVEYDEGEGSWVEIAVYEGVIDTVAVYQIFPPKTATKLRFHFISDDAWSDEDGLHTTDGAAHVDSITVADDTGIIDFEDFESASDGDRSCGIWHADVREAFGMYSGLRTNLIGKDPCNHNLSTQIVFFIGSDDVSSKYPNLYNTPACKGPGGVEAPCQDEIVISPVIDLTRYSTMRDESQDAVIPPAKLPDLGATYLIYSVYRDLPYSSLVYYDWYVRSIDSSGCPGRWESYGFFYPYWENEVYETERNDIGRWIESDSIQVALGIHDMCDKWYGVYGDCQDHTPSPWFDNIRILRYDKSGPQWYYRDVELFQDNFPGSDSLESWVRADMAKDINPLNNPVVSPGDSIVVECTSPLGGGIAEEAGGPRIYMHVKVSYIGGGAPKAPPSGAALEGSCGHYAGMDGGWTIIQGDSARYAGRPLEDRYMFDLNDSLLTRGFMVEYYFKAYDNAGKSTTLPGWAEEGHEHPYPGGSYVFEFTCLPTLRSPILYVDGCHGCYTFEGAAQLYLDPTFNAVLADSLFPDRYDVNAPRYFNSNGLASRARNGHLTGAYETIIWDAGRVSDGSGNISDGEQYYDKSDDCRMLIDWMDASQHDCGLWIMGQNAAQHLHEQGSLKALELLGDWCGAELANGSYFELTGGFGGSGVMMPCIKTAAGSGSCWSDVDSFCVTANCPYYFFDVLDTTSGGEHALRYPDYSAMQHHAGIQSGRTNSEGYNVRTMLFGFSFMDVLDAYIDAPIIRHKVMDAVNCWLGMGGTNPDITDVDDILSVNALAQNYPNPFNPATTIEYHLASRGAVSIRIYDVTGRLVRTLARGMKDAGRHEVVWRGRNDAGVTVASGIYFYEMKAAGFTATRKMVVLR